MLALISRAKDRLFFTITDIALDWYYRLYRLYISLLVYIQIAYTPRNPIAPYKILHAHGKNGGKYADITRHVAAYYNLPDKLYYGEEMRKFLASYGVIVAVVTVVLGKIYDSTLYGREKIDISVVEVDLTKNPSVFPPDLANKKLD